MTTPSSTSRMETVKKYRHLLALVIAALLIIVSWIGIHSIAGDTKIAADTKTSWMSVFTVLLNLASTVIAFFIASVMFSKENEQHQESFFRSIVFEALNVPSNLAQIPWADLIENAAEIDFVVQGWNGWAEQRDTARALTKFFEKSGIFRLYVCHPTSAGASQSRAFLEERIGRTPVAVVEEINGTYRSINEAREQRSDQIHGDSRIELYQTDNLNWYFAAFFKGKKSPGATRARDVIVFSVYSHTPQKPWLMPAIMIYPDMHQNLLEWFDKELSYLREGAPKDVG